MRTLLLLLLWSLPLLSQTYPAHPVPQTRSFHDVIRDPYFVYPSVLQWSSVGFDSYITIVGLRQGVCVEGNQTLGPHPSPQRVILTNLAVDGLTTAFRYVAIAVIPKNDHSWTRWIGRGTSIGLAVYSAKVHTVAGSHWYTRNCL